jgi:subtilase family serine protease
VNLCVTVENFGDATETFDVVSTVDGFTDTTTISNLAPGDTTTICFNWVPTDTITNTFTSCTELPTDIDTTNDCDNTPIISIDCTVHDVGVIALIAPDTICVDSTVNLCVTVQNFGNVTDTFDVISTVDGFADTQTVDLASGDTTTICFNWVPTDTITYTFLSCTDLSTDSDTTNDCDSQPIEAIDCAVHDVGVVALITPDTVCVDSTINLCVTVENFGDATETFDVVSIVNGIADTQQVSSLAPGDTATICFNWTPIDTITYTFTSCTELLTDIDTTNDCDSQPIEAIDCAVHDVGVIALIAPDTVCINSTVNLCVTVENFGDATETFDVISTVNGTADTQQVSSLAPGDTTTICFNWVPTDTITYTFASCTELPTDIDTTNDCDSQPIEAIDCAVHDVGVIALIAPDTVCVDSTVNLCVTVQNFGNVTDTFDVISTVDGFADTQTVDLTPGDTTTICFNWTPTDTITYTFISCTELSTDIDTTNDCDNQLIEAIDCAVHDVGVITLIAPDTVCVDSTINLCVTVENFGDATETFDVISIVNGTADTQQVSNLAAGDTTTICFNWVPTDTITYTFTSCTKLPTDIDTTNDCDNSSIVSIDCAIVGLPEIPSELIPKSFTLSQNLPNPFSRNTQIRYALPQVEDKITVQEILVNQSQEPGYYTISWDANSYSNGIYFYRLKAQMGQAGDFIETRKMILLR